MNSPSGGQAVPLAGALSFPWNEIPEEVYISLESIVSTI